MKTLPPLPNICLKTSESRRGCSFGRDHDRFDIPGHWHQQTQKEPMQASADSKRADVKEWTL